MSNETVARRYAGALADVVLNGGDKQLIQSELEMFGKMIRDNQELAEVFQNPAIQHYSKEKVLESLIERSKPSKTTANFLRILLRNNRLTDITQINEKFESVLSERSGIVTAQVTSARPLGDKEKSELQANLTKMTGKQITLDFKTDENLIGGVVTRIGSTVYDGSVRTQLDNLRQQLVNG